MSILQNKFIIYDAVYINNGSNTREDANELRDKLGKRQGIENIVNEIVESYCYIYKEKHVNAPDHDWCFWFYYWVGSTIFKESKESGFVDFMEKVYNALEKVSVARKCKKIDEYIAESTFKQMRKMYEYYQDYGTIKQQLQRSGNQCDEKYDQHLQDILNDYDKVKSICGAAATYKEHCSAFQDMFNNQDYKNLLTQPREVMTVSESMEELSVPSTENTSLSTVISSTIVTLIGLPAAVAFFLYKYNLLPSWINGIFIKGSNKNSNNKNRRKRTTAMGRHNFNDLTENGSTIGSPTDYSTSNLSTDNSTIYDCGRNNKYNLLLLLPYIISSMWRIE
ncbi:KIR protein [Plasmodium coatneyi]|uniref:KIR protein n=1 Tax=Plasmodium coatneyi TaxID=208452 RepID=A0A1B1DXM6_9APIC|nr:KIR protein [Plasmodium coatneyi]ANQ07518.1 KIR protein [Plasmodium coatneyi]